MTNKLLIGLAAVVVAGFAALFGGVLVRSRAARRRRARRRRSRSRTSRPASRSTRARPRSSPSLQATLDANPKDEHSWMLLGLAYQQRARETGDPTYYTKSDGALHRALALDSEGLPRLQRARLARALAPPLRRGARARRAGARARADDAHATTA